VLLIRFVTNPRKVHGSSGEVGVFKSTEKEQCLESRDRGSRPPAEGHRILVVDDDRAYRYLTKRLFAGVPHEFIEAVDGVEGLEAAHNRHPELIFLDLLMPRMSGFEMLEELRSDPETRDIPVIVSSSRWLSHDEQQHLEGLHAAFLPKDRFAEGTEAVHDILDGMGLSGLLRDPHPSTSDSCPSLEPAR